MTRKNILDHFKKVELPDPVDIVIEQIHDMIHEGYLKPGDRLPSEKSIEKKMSISRGSINKAIRRLETYGILKTIPQSGTYVAAIGVNALEGLLTNVLKIENKELEALDDTRHVLEIYSVRLVAKYATEDELKEIEDVHEIVSKKIIEGRYGFDEDMVFHLKLAEYCGNPILKSIITLLISEVLNLFQSLEKRIDSEIIHERLLAAIDEHKKIIYALNEHDSEKAGKAMEDHFKAAKIFRKSILPKN